MCDEQSLRAESAPPRVSVVLPVFNVERYLVECLDSIVAQDYPNLEIIAVDDGSTDRSLKVLEDYAAAHPQVKVLHQDNSGAGIARNRGIVAAAGKYIWFVDPDDAIEPGAVRDLVGMAEKFQTDVVVSCLARYDSELENLITVSLHFPQAAKLPEVFSGEDIADTIYTTFRDGPSPCNKFFRREFVMENGLQFQALPRVNDLCFSYSALALSRRTHVVNNAYYRYRTARKGSSQNSTDKDPSPVCAAYAKLQEVLSSAGKFEKFSRSFYRAFYGSCSYTFRQLRKAETAGRLLALLRADGVAPIAGARLGRESFKNDAEFARYVAFWGETRPYRLMIDDAQRHMADAMPELDERDGRKCLGVICGSLCMGGIERVVTQLVPMFVGRGFDIVLMTREPPSAKEYALPKGCIRVVVGRDSADMSRYSRIRVAILKYGIGTVVDHEYYLLTIGQDIDAIHSAGARAVVHHHSVFSNMYLRDNRELALPELLKAYRSADAMVTLSDADADFFNLMGCRAVKIADPVPDVPPCERDACCSRTIVWCARFVDGKRPLDAVRIFELVLKKVPDARLTMLGDGERRQMALVEDYLASRPQLRKAVFLAGRQSDVFAYERTAGVFLTTSKFDGFSLSIVEAKAMGLPVVAYAMPYLETLRPGTGAVSVPQGDVGAAADVIIKIFGDCDLRRDLSRQARASYEHFASQDLWSQYERMLAVAGEPRHRCDFSDAESSSRVIVATLLEHVDTAFRRVLAQEKSLDLRVAPSRRPKSAVWLLRKMRGGVACLVENGLEYTVKHAFGKAMRRLGCKNNW